MSSQLRCSIVALIYLKKICLKFSLVFCLSSSMNFVYLEKKCGLFGKIMKFNAVTLNLFFILSLFAVHAYN
jgi:hypothetical protein